MYRCHLVERHTSDNRVFYRASDEAASYVELLETNYSNNLKVCANWLADEVKLRTKPAFKKFVGEQIGEWNEAFSAVGGTSQQGP
jgi:hypothetical protein